MKKNIVLGVVGLVLVVVAAWFLVPVKVQLMTSAGISLFAVGAIGLFMLWLAFFEKADEPAEKTAEKSASKSEEKAVKVEATVEKSEKPAITVEKPVKAEKPAAVTEYERLLEAARARRAG